MIVHDGFWKDVEGSGHDLLKVPIPHPLGVTEENNERQVYLPT